MNLEKFDSAQRPDSVYTQQIIDFLLTNLEQFGDERADIEKCVNYALQKSRSPGGFILIASEGTAIVGALIINRTGMEGYIPENILVYIATLKAKRGTGIGKTLMRAAIAETEGNIALHVEPDNPARFLYEKLGFTNKYLEMRLAK